MYIASNESWFSSTLLKPEGFENGGFTLYWNVSDIFLASTLLLRDFKNTTLTGPSPVPHRSLTGLSPVPHRSLTGPSPASHRSLTGQFVFVFGENSVREFTYHRGHRFRILRSENVFSSHENRRRFWNSRLRRIWRAFSKSSVFVTD